MRPVSRQDFGDDFVYPDLGGDALGGARLSPMSMTALTPSWRSAVTASWEVWRGASAIAITPAACRPPGPTCTVVRPLVAEPLRQPEGPAALFGEARSGRYELGRRYRLPDVAWPSGA